MKNKIILKNIIIILNIAIYFYLVFWKRNQYVYNMTYFKCILFMIINSVFIYASGILINKEKEYKSNNTLYIVLFGILLFSFTFIIARPKLQFYTWTYGGQYKLFDTIVSQLEHGSVSSIMKNILGNCMMLIPISFLLMIRTKKFDNVFIQSVINLPIIIFIEILQAFTHTGTFDVDDIFLNYIGTIIFTFLITRFDIIGKIRNLFYTDFKLNNTMKLTIFYIALVIVIVFDINMLVIKFLLLL